MNSKGKPVKKNPDQGKVKPPHKPKEKKSFLPDPYIAFPDSMDKCMRHICTEMDMGPKGVVALGKAGVMNMKSLVEKAESDGFSEFDEIREMYPIYLRTAAKMVQEMIYDDEKSEDEILELFTEAKFWKCLKDDQ